MGGGISRPLLSGRRPEPVVEAITTKANTPSADSATGPAVAGRRDSSRLPTAIDARIVATLRQLNLTRRAGAKTKAPNFERIVLKFALAREAFVTINAIYDQFADVRDVHTLVTLKVVLNAPLTSSLRALGRQGRT